MKRYYVVVEGQVQGVGFRWTVQNNATQLNITGWVRNMSNGMVEMEIQGNDKDLDVFLFRIRQKDRFIRVDDLRLKPVAVNPRESGFKVQY